jgi:Flp pilus assembly protein TadG
MVRVLMRVVRRLRSGERGAALVEAAVVIPLLLFVCTGILEFGRAYQTWQVLTNAAREGARVAVLPGVGNDAVRDRVEAYMTAGQLTRVDEAEIDVTRNNTISIGADTASASRVTVRYPFSFMVLQPIARLVVGETSVGGPLTMSASALMRNE